LVVAIIGWGGRNLGYAARTGNHFGAGGGWNVTKNRSFRNRPDERSGEDSGDFSAFAPFPGVSTGGSDERTRRAQQVTGGRGARHGPAAAPHGHHAVGAGGPDRSHRRPGRQGAAQSPRDGPGGVPRVLAAGALDEHRPGADVPDGRPRGERLPGG